MPPWSRQYQREAGRFRWLCRRAAEAVAACFYHHEGGFEIGLRVVFQDSLKLCVDRRQGGGGEAEVDYADGVALGEDQAAKVAVTGDEDPALRVSCLQYGGIGGPRQTRLDCRYDIVTEVAEQALREPVDVLIEQELHGAGVTWSSSAFTTSMAYCRQARMSSRERSG